MTLPTSGAITAALINIELGRPANALFSLDDPQVRALAGKPTGAISFNDFYGKSSYVREPAVGENYNPPTSSVPSYWAVPTSTNGVRPKLYWEGQLITTYFWHATNALVHGNWLYHIGGFKSTLSIEGNWYNVYGVWRETAPAGSQTREPPTDQWYDTNHRWRERGNNQAWVVWDGVQTFATSSGFDHKVLDGWDYHRGAFVENKVENGFTYKLYRIYRVKQ